WRTFVARYGPKISGWCRQWRLQQADVENVTQDVLCKLVRVLPNFVYDPGKGTFRGWLKTVTDNAVKESLKKDRINGVVAPPDVIEGLKPSEDLQNNLADVYDCELLDVGMKRVQSFRGVSSRDLQIFRE